MFSHVRKLLLVATTGSSSISAATLHPPPPLEARPPTRRNFLHSSHRQWPCKEKREEIGVYGKQ